jgi:transposase
MVLATRRKKDAFAARRLLIEAAWSCRFPARIGDDLLLRQGKLSKPVRDMAWKV